MLRACIKCNDEYYGDSWGVTFLPKTKEITSKETLWSEIVMCFYCYYDQKERQYKPEWETITN